jgi:hypothetical protein
MVEDTSELIELVSYLSTPLASSSLLGNSMSCSGSSILSFRAVFRSSGWYFRDSSNVNVSGVDHLVFFGNLYTEDIG